MTVAEAIRAAAARLSTTSGTARLDAELLMALALGATRSQLLLRHMDETAPETFAALVDRRAACEPIAYITGVQEFYGRDFAVKPGVLIPRSDSETVVEAALSACPSPKRVLDLGVGSGALLLTMMAERPGCSGVGIDTSPIAIDVAGENAVALDVQGDWDLHLRDWRQPEWDRGLGEFDCILANPPYVEQGADLDRDVSDFEPASALFAGAEGLDDYRILIPDLRNLMCHGATAVLEIGASQSEAVTELAENAGFAVSLRHDLANRPRALILS
ncbi:MAG: peptide chain release factor N(5)-glutamine methyltransferase [Pseudomonadota bacterium]